MSVVQKKTKYIFDGNEYPYTLVANDTLATQIRNNTFSDVTISEAGLITKESFIQALENYVGDITDIAFIVPSYVEETYPARFAKMKEIFSNVFSVLSVSPYTLYDDYFSFADVTCDGIGRNEDFKILGTFTSSDAGTNRANCSSVSSIFQFINAFSSTESDYRVWIWIPIFLESELANDTIPTISGRFSFLQIKYSYQAEYSTPTGTITLSAARTSADPANLNIFAGKSIPDAPIPPEPPSTDPYAPGGYSGAGGGQGNYDAASDPIPIPALPSSISTATRLFSAFNPSLTDLGNFANALWNKDPSTIDDWFRLLFGGDAFNAIIGLSMIPVAPDTISGIEIKLGNWATGVSAPLISNQYKEVDFGTVALSEFWGNSIDYAPYTKVQLALPYIGIVDVDTDDVIGSANHLVYHIDVLSGAICAMLHCTKGNLASVIYQWSGSCAVQLPITGSAFTSVIGAIMAVGATALGVGAFAASGLGAALPAAAVAAGGTAAVSGAAANMFGSMKGNVQKSGSFTANSGALGIMTPYFIITRPVQSVPTSWQADKGYPANISALLSTVTGYTEISQINLECSGTEEEKAEIIKLLKTGVIF